VLNLITQYIIVLLYMSHDFYTCILYVLFQWHRRQLIG